MSAKIIYAKNIEELPTGDLNKVGTVKLGEEKLSGQKLKQRLAEEVRGGKTLTALEKNLKAEGLAGGQQKKRATLMGVIGGKGDGDNKKKPVPWYRRALATTDTDISKETGVSLQGRRGGASSVSVDTSATGGKMRSRINPLSGAAGPAVDGRKK
ncbi:MAG: hypothetical protein AAB956_04220 [Patescibacteria group bacterium]